MPEALLCFCLQNVYHCVDLITNARNANVLLPWPTASMSFVGHSIASVIKQFAKTWPTSWNPNIFCRKFDVLLWLISHGSHMRNWERSGACSWTRTERAQCHQEEICSYFSPQLQQNASVIVCVCVWHVKWEKWQNLARWTLQHDHLLEKGTALFHAFTTFWPFHFTIQGGLLFEPWHQKTAFATSQVPADSADQIWCYCATKCLLQETNGQDVLAQEMATKSSSHGTSWSHRTKEALDPHEIRTAWAAPQIRSWCNSCCMSW